VPKQIARVEVTMNDEGLVEVTGTGALLAHKAYALGLLELAKEVINGRTRAIGAPSAADLDQFTRQ
jgi:hypothetical protein